MPVEDVFSIEGRGTVVTGRVDRGVDQGRRGLSRFIGLKPTQKTVCTGVEMFRKLLDQGQAGDNIGCLLRGTKKEDVRARSGAGQARIDHAAYDFQGEVYVLSKGRGWDRHTPFFKGYRPQFYIRHDRRDG